MELLEPRKPHCGSMWFQTGIRTAVLFGTGTAGIAKIAGIGTTGIAGTELLELHGTSYILNVSTCKYVQFQCSFMQFLQFQNGIELLEPLKLLEP